MPTTKSMADYDSPANPECRHGICQTQILTVVTAPKASNDIGPCKFSSLRKLIRVMARTRRLAVKIRPRKYDQHRKEGRLTPEELQQADIYLIKQA